MERLTVTLGERSYPITIAAGLFNDPASFLPSSRATSYAGHQRNAGAALSGYRPLCAEAVRVNVDSVILPDGEQYKSPAVMDTVFTALLQNHMAATPLWWRLAR